MYREPRDNWQDIVYEWACLNMHTGRQCFWRGVLCGGSFTLVLASLIAWSIAVGTAVR